MVRLNVGNETSGSGSSDDTARSDEGSAGGGFAAPPIDEREDDGDSDGGDTGTQSSSTSGGFTPAPDVEPQQPEPSEPQGGSPDASGGGQTDASGSAGDSTTQRADQSTGGGFAQDPTQDQTTTQDQTRTQDTTQGQDSFDPNEPDQFGDLNQQELTQVADAARESNRFDGSDLEIRDGQIMASDEARQREQRASRRGQALEGNQQAIETISGQRTARQREGQRAQAQARQEQLPEANRQFVAGLSSVRTQQQRTKQQTRQQAADIFSEQSDVTVAPGDVTFTETESGQLQPELMPGVRQEVNQSITGQVSERQTTQQRIQQRTRQQAAGVFSEQVGFDVPTSAVDLETVQTDEGAIFRPELNTEAAKEAGREQGDIFSGVVGVTEGALGGAAERVTGQDDVDLIPGDGSIANVARVEGQANQRNISGTLPDEAQTLEQEFGDAGQIYSEQVAQPIGDVAAFGDLAFSLDPRDTTTAFERAETATTAFEEGNLGEGFRSLSGEAQGTQTFSDRFVQGAAGGAAEIGNLPGLASTAISGVDIAATGVDAVTSGEGGEFAAAAGGAGVAVAEQAAQTAADNPTRTLGMLSGGAVAGTAVSPFRATRLDVDTKPETTRVDVDTSSAQATRGVETETADTSVDIPAGEGGTTTVRGLRVQTPAIAETFGIRSRGRTVAGSRDGRPTIGSPSLASQVDEIDLSTLGTTGTATAEARSAFEADVFRETATDVNPDFGEQFRASEAVQRQAQLQRNPDFTVETAEEAIGQARAVPESSVKDVTEALRETDATVFGSAAARAQTENFREPRDLDIVVEDKAEAKPILEGALEGEEATVDTVFDIKEVADVPGRAAGGEPIKFGRTSQEPRELGGVPFNPVGEELTRKAGASAFIREPGAAGTPEFDVGPEPRRPGRADVREKDVQDTQMLAEELGIFDTTQRRFETAFGLSDEPQDAIDSVDVDATDTTRTTGRPAFGFNNRAMAGGGRDRPDETEMSRREFLQRSGAVAAGAGLFSDLDFDVGLGDVLGGIRRQERETQSRAGERAVAVAEARAGGDLTPETVRQELSLGSAESELSQSGFRQMIQQEIETGRYDVDVLQEAVERGSFSTSDVFDELRRTEPERRRTDAEATRATRDVSETGAGRDSGPEGRTRGERDNQDTSPSTGRRGLGGGPGIPSGGIFGGGGDGGSPFNDVTDSTPFGSGNTANFASSGSSKSTGSLPVLAGNSDSSDALPGLSESTTDIPAAGGSPDSTTTLPGFAGSPGEAGAGETQPPTSPVGGGQVPSPGPSPVGTGLSPGTGPSTFPDPSPGPDPSPSPSPVPGGQPSPGPGPGPLPNPDPTPDPRRRRLEGDSDDDRDDDEFSQITPEGDRFQNRVASGSQFLFGSALGDSVGGDSQAAAAVPEAQEVDFGGDFDGGLFGTDGL